MNFKDLFSKQAVDYAAYRPRYPNELFNYLSSLVQEHRLAWDCGTGSGQAAVALASCFEQVLATDPSEKQLESAEKNPKVTYQKGYAEKVLLADQSVDLVTVAQAFHWFKHEEFFKEVRRVLKPGGVLAVWTYGLARITPELDALVHELCEDVLAGYWEKERSSVEQGYRNLPFPFEEIVAPRFEMSAEWSLQHLVGYLNTWSALQTYVKRNAENPLESFIPRLQDAWGVQGPRPVHWDLVLRLGR